MPRPKTRYNYATEQHEPNTAYDYAEARKLGNRKNFAAIVAADLARLNEAREFKDRQIDAAVEGYNPKEGDHPTLLPQGKARKKVRGY